MRVETITSRYNIKAYLMLEREKKKRRRGKNKNFGMLIPDSDLVLLP